MAGTHICQRCGKLFDPLRPSQVFCSSGCRTGRIGAQVLILPIRERWFQMIADGVKKEEYRDIKPYWTVRFSKLFGINSDGTIKCGTGRILLRAGYGRNVPELTAVCSVRQGTGKPEWGAEEGKEYYILTIHSVEQVKGI